VPPSVSGSISITHAVIERGAVIVRPVDATVIGIAELSASADLEVRRDRRYLKAIAVVSASRVAAVASPFTVNTSCP
jgi:hypothetical protein